MEAIKVLVSKKADVDQLNRGLADQNKRINSVNEGMVNVLNDVKQFQSVLSKIKLTVHLLEDANKDILLGKRRLDCLSCGVGQADTTICSTAGLLQQHMHSAENLKQDNSMNSLRVKSATKRANLTSTAQLYSVTSQGYYNDQTQRHAKRNSVNPTHKNSLSI